MDRVKALMCEAAFNVFLVNKKPGTREAVIYDQFGCRDKLVRHVSGTWDEILEQYRFYKEAMPDRTLGLVCKEYFELIVTAMPRPTGH